MAVKTQKMHEGKLYYSMPAAARLLGTTTPKLKQLLIPEGFEWANFRVKRTNLGQCRKHRWIPFSARKSIAAAQ